MNQQRRWAIGCAAVLGLALLACKGIGRMSPEKACDKMAEIMGEPLDAEAKAKCVTAATQSKKEKPERYDCETGCLKKSSDKTALTTCMGACGGSGSALASDDTASGGDDDGIKDRPDEVDNLTADTLKSNLSSAYQYKGYELMKEASNAVGWAGTIRVGDPKRYDGLGVYRVMLIDILSTKDGYEQQVKLKAGKSVATSYRIGSKKMLFVECLLQRSSGASGPPQPCGGYDSNIEYVVKDAVK